MRAGCARRWAHARSRGAGRAPRDKYLAGGACQRDVLLLAGLTPYLEGLPALVGLRRGTGLYSARGPRRHFPPLMGRRATTVGGTVVARDAAERGSFAGPAGRRRPLSRTGSGGSSGPRGRGAPSEIAALLRRVRELEASEPRRLSLVGPGGRPEGGSHPAVGAAPSCGALPRGGRRAATPGRPIRNADSSSEEESDDGSTDASRAALRAAAGGAAPHGSPPATLGALKQELVAQMVRAIRRRGRVASVADPRFAPLLSTKTYRLADRQPGYSAEQRKAGRALRKDVRDMMMEQGQRFDRKGCLWVISFLRKLKNACDAVGMAEGAAICLLQWLETDDVFRVVQRAVPLGATEGAMPLYKDAIHALLEKYLDEDILTERVRALNEAQQHARETEGAFADRLLLLNGALGSMMEETEMKTILLQGCSPEVRELGRQYNTRDRAYTKLKPNLDRTGKASREMRGVELAAKARLSTKLKTKITPAPPAKMAASAALVADAMRVQGTATPSAPGPGELPSPQEYASHVLSLLQAYGTPAAPAASPAGIRQLPAFGGILPPLPTQAPAAGRGRLGPGTSFPGLRQDTVYPDTDRAPVAPRGGRGAFPYRQPGRCSYCPAEGHWMLECPEMPAEVRERGRQMREALAGQGRAPEPPSAASQAAAEAARRAGAAAALAVPRATGDAPTTAGPLGALGGVHMLKRDPLAEDTTRTGGRRTTRDGRRANPRLSLAPPRTPPTRRKTPRETSSGRPVLWFAR